MTTTSSLYGLQVIGMEARLKHNNNIHWQSRANHLNCFISHTQTNTQAHAENEAFWPFRQSARMLMKPNSLILFACFDTFHRDRETSLNLVSLVSCISLILLQLMPRLKLIFMKNGCRWNKYGFADVKCDFHKFLASALYRALINKCHCNLSLSFTARAIYCHTNGSLCVVKRLFVNNNIISVRRS